MGLNVVQGQIPNNMRKVIKQRYVENEYTWYQCEFTSYLVKLLQRPNLEPCLTLHSPMFFTGVCQVISHGDFICNYLMQADSKYNGAVLKVVLARRKKQRHQVLLSCN